MFPRMNIRDSLLAIASVALAVVTPLAFSIYAWHSWFFYDDAYMFYRYAYNLHHFHAIIWNAGGSHTYGTTSLPWMFVITAFSYLPLSQVIVLPLASSLFFIAAAVLLAYGLSKNALSLILQRFWPVFFVLLLSFVTSVPFLFNVTGGMETMLSLLANSALCLLAWKALNGSLESRTIYLLSGCAFFAYCVRPESGICDLLTPALVIFLSERKDRLPRIFQFAFLTSTLIVLQLLACKFYFGTALPLSFYAKSTGISKIEYADWPHNFYFFCGLATIYLAAIVLVVHRKHWRILVAFLFPTFFTFLYLDHVIQLTAEYGRYYCPFLPYFIIPAFSIADEYVHTGIPISTKELLQRFIVVAAIMSISTGSYGGPVAQYMVQTLTSHVNQPSDLRSFRPYDPTLPAIPQKQDLIAFSDDVACHMPTEAKIAAGEDGYLSGQCPHTYIIDMGGLNDTVIALTGFSADYVLQENPDLIWMPNPDFYTRWRRDILLDPEFQQKYDFVADAFNFGIAIRKDSQYRPQILAVLRRAWPKYYPNTCIAPICEAPVQASVDRNTESLHSPKS